MNGSGFVLLLNQTTMEKFKIPQESLDAYRCMKPFNFLGVINERDVKHLCGRYGLNEHYMSYNNNFMFWEQPVYNSWVCTSLVGDIRTEGDYDDILDDCKEQLIKSEDLQDTVEISTRYYELYIALTRLKPNEILITYDISYLVKVVDKSELRTEQNEQL